MAIHWVDKAEWNARRHVMEGDGIVIFVPGFWENDDADSLDWFAVSDVDGIFVYADTQEEADTLAAHFEKTAKLETTEEHKAR